MPSPRPLVRLLLSLGAFLLLPALVAGAGETKTFEAQNFQITLPSDSWQEVPLNSDQQANGYVAALGRRVDGTTAIVHLRVQPQSTPPLSLDDLTREVRDGLSGSLPSVEGSRVDKAKLSGLDGTMVVVKGKNQRDEPTLLRALTILAEGRFHQMIFILVGGAETKQAAELEALRRGYRLLQGAGPEEPAGPDVPGLGGEGGGDLPAGSGKPVAREGRTLSFPTQNLKWTLPEGSPFGWAAITDDEAAAEGTLVRAEARVERPALEKPAPDGEGQADKGPRVNAARVFLNVGPMEPGWTPQALVNSMQLRANIEQNVFDKMDYGRTKVIDEMEVGNVTGAALQMVGQKEGRARFFRLYAVGLKGKRYTWECLFEGDGSVDDDFSKPLAELISKVEFLDTQIWVRGPLGVNGVPSADQERGSGHGQEKEVKSLGIVATKPAEMYDVNIDMQNSGGNLRFAWETRTADKQAYLYVDLQSWTRSSLQQTRDYAEQMIVQREGQWKEVAKSPTTVTKGKEPFFKANYGKGRGLGYEFLGYVGDVPYVETGFVVEGKDYVYWVRIQYGGTDARKTFEKLVKAVGKGLKMS